AGFVCLAYYCTACAHRRACNLCLQLVSSLQAVDCNLVT
ncbi:hypothetical protein L195_g061586, partial [Trifolium pratense]